MKSTGRSHNSPTRALRRLWLALSAGVVGCLAAAFGAQVYRSAASLNAFPGPSQLRVAIEKKPGSLDTTEGTSIEAHFVQTQVYERLVRANPDGSFRGELAASWQSLPDLPGYEFEIRQDARFSDGTPVEAKDVERTLRKVVRSGQIRHLLWIVGAEAYRHGKSDSISGIEVVDAHRIRFKLTRYDERFIRSLWNPRCSVLQATHPGFLALGSGPYQISRYDMAAGRIELQFNPYFRRRLPEFAKVIISVEPGDYDLAFSKPQNGLDRYITTKYFDAEMYYLGFNLMNPRVADLRERQRLAGLLTEDLVRPFFPTRHNLIGGVIPFGVFGYSADLGLPSLPGPDRLRSAVSSRNLVLTSFQPMLRDLSRAYCDKLSAAKTPCRIIETDVAGLNAAKLDNSLQIFLSRNKMSDAEAEAILSSYTSTHSLNRFTNGRLEIDHAIEQALARLSEVPLNQTAELLRKIQQVDQIIVGNLLVKPFAYGGERQIWHVPNIEMPPVSLMGMLDLDLGDIHRLD